MPLHSLAEIPRRQSIKPHTKSTKFLSREATTDTPASREAAIRIQTGVNRSVTPGTDKTKNKPRRGGRTQTGVERSVTPGRQSIKPHTKSTKFLSREAAQESETGVERSGTPGTDKINKNKPRRGGRICSLCTITVGRDTLIPDFWIPRNSLQLSRCIHNCTLQILRGRDARVPTVHSGG